MIDFNCSSIAKYNKTYFGYKFRRSWTNTDSRMLQVGLRPFEWFPVFEQGCSFNVSTFIMKYSYRWACVKESATYTTVNSAQGKQNRFILSNNTLQQLGDLWKRKITPHQVVCDNNPNTSVVFLGDSTNLSQSSRMSQRWQSRSRPVRIAYWSRKKTLNYWIREITSFPATEFSLVY